VTTTREPTVTLPRLSRLPGRARPRAQVLKEVQEQVRKRRERLDPALWSLLVPGPEKHFRWRVQLDCDCILELRTYGEDRAPHETSWIDPATGFGLPKGQVPCHHPTDEPAPYRAITKWISRREVTSPADPAECPADEDPAVRRLLHRNEPKTSAFWRVELECGHIGEVCTDLEWDPAAEPTRVSPERQAEMIAEFESFWENNPPASVREERDREHYERMLAKGWPRPFTERDCWSCRSGRRIVVYQRVGWLVPPLKPAAPKPPDKDALQKRLREAEAEAERLRRELESLE
jgi:hypothetical protein